MTDCPHTGLSVPECSCRACIQAQIERYRPSLLSNAHMGNGSSVLEGAAILDGGSIEMTTVEGSVVARFPRLKHARRRLRRSRRAA
jgi:hypothetical protein